MQSSLRFARLYSDEAGVSHFGQVEIAVALREFAPPAKPFGVSLLSPGDALLLEDTTGHGHVTRVVSPEAATLAAVRRPRP